MYVHMHFKKLWKIHCHPSSLFPHVNLFFPGYRFIWEKNLCLQNHIPMSESTTVSGPRILHAHKNRVYDLHCLKGCVTTSGHNSLFPTFIGHSAADVEKKILISVGSVRGLPFSEQVNSLQDVYLSESVFCKHLVSMREPHLSQFILNYLLYIYIYNYIHSEYSFLWHTTRVHIYIYRWD